MDLAKNLFAVKVNELRGEYERFLSGLELLGTQDVGRMQEIIRDMEEESERQRQSLKRTVREARSPAAARLASIELDYLTQMQNVMDEAVSQAEPPDDPDQNAEAMALYTEYAIDTANRAVRHAYLSALRTVNMDREGA